MAISVRILHGDDEETIRTVLRTVESGLRATGLAELIFQVLDGKNTDGEAFSNAVYAPPLIADQRVVVLNNPLAMAGGRDGNQRFLTLLNSIPETTCLILVLHDTYERRDWAALPAKSFLRKWAAERPDSAVIETHARPDLNGMRGWITAKANELGGQIEPGAARLLIGMIGNDTGEARQALDKLLLYVDFARPIDESDVSELITANNTVNIFAMIDDLVAGNAKSALIKLHQLIEEQDVPGVLAMITRQFRLLVQAREILDEGGGTGAIMKELGQIEFVANKLGNQARAFSMNRLCDLFGELVEIDRGLKTSQSDPLTALDLFAVSVASGKRK